MPRQSLSNDASVLKIGINTTENGLGIPSGKLRKPFLRSAKKIVEETKKRRQRTAG